jgi:hypothetical protein
MTSLLYGGTFIVALNLPSGPFLWYLHIQGPGLFPATGPSSGLSLLFQALPVSRQKKPLTKLSEAFIFNGRDGKI